MQLLFILPEMYSSLWMLHKQINKSDTGFVVCTFVHSQFRALLHVEPSEGHTLLKKSQHIGLGWTSYYRYCKSNAAHACNFFNIRDIIDITGLSYDFSN
jgi:hypothetical protein